MSFFKKFLKTAKKVAPIALTAGAVVFTAGAAFGKTGGWGDIVSGITKGVGLDGVVGDILAGAVTQAGYGAVLGGVTSMIAGGDFMDGAQKGALGGLVTGGVMGGIGGQDLADPLKGMFGNGETGETGQAAVSQAAALAPVAGSQAAALDAPLGKASEALRAAGGGHPGETGNVMRSLGEGARTSARGGGAGGGGGGGAAPGFFGEGGWLERNGEFVGKTVSGLGGGLLSMASAEEPGAEAQARQAVINQNYGGMTGLLTPGGVGPTAQGPAPGEVYDQQVYGTAGPGRYVYDPRQRRVVFVPNKQAVA